MKINHIYCGNVLNGLPEIKDESINCCITSPPYWGLRDYGIEGQIGLEETPEEYVDNLVKVFREVKRVLKNDGTLWLNLGDCYNGSGKAFGQKPEHKNCGKIKQKRGYDVPKPTMVNYLKPKDLIGIPWMVALALRADGWYLRQDIIWYKKNPMPESVTDRCTKAHEYIFLLSKSKRYYFDYEAIQEKSIWAEKDNRFKSGPTVGGKTTSGIYAMHSAGAYQENGMRNKRSVWEVNLKPFNEAHFATFPENLIVDCIKAGCPEGGIVLDPFMGAGTTALVSRKLNRNYIGKELKQDYIEISNKRLYNELGMFL